MKDLTQGSVLRHLLSLSGFVLVGMAMLTLYSLVDLYFVGHLGARAVAAVAISSNLMMISMSLSQMLGVGTGALVAQAVGRKDADAAHRTFNQAFGIALLMALLFVLALRLGEAAYISAFSADDETAIFTAGYLRWFVPSMALQFPLMVMSSALRGTGSMVPATAAQIGSVVLNIALAPVLIFGLIGAPRLGVEGAGLATFLASFAGFAGLLFYFGRPQAYLKLQLRGWRPQFRLWGQILKIGLPSAAEFALMGCYLIFITALLKPFGASQQAAFGIGQRLLQATMMPAMALSFAATALAGQNFGARRAERVRATFIATLKLGIPLAVLLWLLMQSLPSVLIGVFSSDPAVLAAGVDFLRVLSFNLIAVTIAFACFGVLSGLGNTVPTLISSTTRIVLIIIPATLLSRQADFRVIWLWYLSVSATVLQMLMNLYFLRRELRRKLGGMSSPGVATAPVVDA